MYLEMHTIVEKKKIVPNSYSAKGENTLCNCITGRYVCEKRPSLWSIWKEVDSRSSGVSETQGLEGNMNTTKNMHPQTRNNYQHNFPNITSTRFCSCFFRSSSMFFWISIRIFSASYKRKRMCKATTLAFPYNAKLSTLPTSKTHG